jgi:hypothetical protein
MPDSETVQAHVFALVFALAEGLGCSAHEWHAPVTDRYIKRGILYKGPVLEEVDEVNYEDMPWEGEDEHLRNPDPNRPRGRGYGAEAFVQRLA